MSKGWLIYATVLSLLTAMAAGSGDGNGIDVLFAVVGNLLVLVLLPWGIVQGVRKMRHKPEVSQ